MNEVSQIITRFAPSPTGMLHIGGARTALFNWLFARHHGGRFLLRIEDTDRQRTTPEAVKAIIAGLEWLELDWDGDIIFQSERATRHQEIARALLDAGKAYYCYCTPEELSEMRQQARAEGRPVRYDGRWRDRDPADAPKDVAPVVRLKAPRTGQTVIDDQVQGRVVIPNDTLDDLILLRSDGTPTYMVSVVVDDHDMAISHIIRGDDHLTNAARQKQIYDALDWTPPVFAHVSLIHGPDGAKLSKRHGAQAVEEYRDMGYLPAAMRNYLLRLGWSHGDDEIITSEQAIAWFSLNGLNKGAARLDFDKLNFVNAHYLRKMEETDLLSQIVPILERTHALTLSDDVRGRLRRALPELKLRAKTLVELADKAAFLVQSRPLSLTDKAAKLMTPENRSLLAGLAAHLAALPDWDHDGLEAALKSFAAGHELKFGAVAQPVRAAVTGGADSPGLIDVLLALGAEESLARLSDQADGGRTVSNDS